MGGVPLRFPKLRFAFQEGGTAWACNLYSDVIGHWEKRNAEAVKKYDPAELDCALLGKLFEQFAEGPVRQRLNRLDEGLGLLSEPMLEGASIDDFAESWISSPEDVRDVFTNQYFFGCEADDPMAAAAFDERLNPLGARIPALFASTSATGMFLISGGCSKKRGNSWTTVCSVRTTFASSPSGARCDFGREPIPTFFKGTSVEKAVTEELTQL